MRAQVKAAVEQLADHELPTGSVWLAATLSADEEERLIADIVADTAPDAQHVGPGLTGGGGRRPRSGKWRFAVGGSIVAAISAAVLVIAPVIVGSFGTAAAATPPLLTYSAVQPATDSHTLLTMLAATATRQQPLANPADAYTYTKIQSWDLHTSQNIDGKLLSGAIVPMMRQTWVAANGSSREVRSHPGQPGSSQQDFGADSPSIYQNLPTDPTALAATLGASHHPDRGTYTWFVAITDVWGVGRPVPPDAQGALLTILADQPDITVLGDTVDRDGRNGVAVSADTNVSGFDEQLILVFDPATGALLSFEEVALTNSSALPVEAPATIGYIMWLTSTNVETLGATP